ncbi:hypothetical protein GCM10023188_41400 [Pontibacter saemangeumensis]|uniref:PepSY domain-containing protein n=1 Tax=Pontibacter saemangeumensis TaxID=1084525 RepID=A0ABP8M3J2_9BACT
MKKITFVAAAIAFVGFFSNEASAQTTTQPQQEQTQMQEQAQPAQQEGTKEAVTQDQLPEPVKTTLASEVYKDWKVGEIYKVSPPAGAADAKVVYEVTMTNAQGQTGSVMLDEAGKDASAK